MYDTINPIFKHWYHREQRETLAYTPKKKHTKDMTTVGGMAGYLQSLLGDDTGKI